MWQYVERVARVHRNLKRESIKGLRIVIRWLYDGGRSNRCRITISDRKDLMGDYL